MFFPCHFSEIKIYIRLQPLTASLALKQEDLTIIILSVTSLLLPLFLIFTASKLEVKNKTPLLNLEKYSSSFSFSITMADDTNWNNEKPYIFYASQ